MSTGAAFPSDGKTQGAPAVDICIKPVISSPMNGDSSFKADKMSMTPLETPSYSITFDEVEKTTKCVSVVPGTTSSQFKDVDPKLSLLSGIKFDSTSSVCVTSTESSVPCKNGEKRQSSNERLQRCRERNRMHARKTRQRKKEHMQNLQSRADELKKEQIRLKQIINEKNTANILLGLFSTGGNQKSGADSTRVDPKVEELLGRAPEDIPDASKVPELPALILPGQHNGKRKRSSSSVDGADKSVLPQHEEFPDDGIDYELLGKDRSKCTPAELDKIRRERNRMHAKRTRDRKRIFMEEMEVIIKRLEEENKVLQEHVQSLGSDRLMESLDSKPSIVSPNLKPSTPQAQPPDAEESVTPLASKNVDSRKRVETVSPIPKEGDLKASAEPLPAKQTYSHQVVVDQIKSLLAAAGAYDKQRSVMGMLTISSAASAVSASTNPSGSGSLCGDYDHDDTSFSNDSSPPPRKRQCLEDVASGPVGIASSVPTSITTHTHAC